MDGEPSTSTFTQHLMSACLVLVVVVVGIVVVGFNELRCQTDISGTRSDKDLNMFWFCLFVFLTRFGCITS